VQEAVSEYHLLQQILDLDSKKSRLYHAAPFHFVHGEQGALTKTVRS
jgi:hypothetical protein